MTNIEKFNNLWVYLFGYSEASLQCRDEVIAAYTSPNRHYHNLDHILWMVDYISTVLYLEKSINLREMKILMIATIYHDVVYNAKRDDNEYWSMVKLYDVLFHCLGLGDDSILSNFIASLILFSNHKPENRKDIQNDIYEPVINMFLDLDLMYGLACPYDEFLKHGENIRKEYSHLSDSEFSKGRKEFFQNLLDRKQILYYFTDSEVKVRENLERYLKEN